MNKKLLPLCLVTSVMMPLASAHLIGGSGFASGAFHPLNGIDHLLAMTAVGIISILVNAKTWWRLPIIFATVMVMGGIAGYLGISLPYVNYGIALSVVLLGLAIVAAKRLSFFWSSALIGLFAFFHGHAHGTELPAIVSPALFILGFVASTILMHLFGVLIGLYTERSKLFSQLIRSAGIVMSGIGTYFLLTI